MQKSEAYWRKTRKLTIGMLILWAVLTFVMNWFAREVNDIVIFGFPLGFYMNAQGLLVVYLAMIWFYNHKMKKLDARFGIDDE